MKPVILLEFEREDTVDYVRARLSGPIKNKHYNPRDVRHIELYAGFVAGVSSRHTSPALITRVTCSNRVIRVAFFTYDDYVEYINEIRGALKDVTIGIHPSCKRYHSEKIRTPKTKVCYLGRKIERCIASSL